MSGSNCSFHFGELAIKEGKQKGGKMRGARLRAFAGAAFFAALALALIAGPVGAQQKKPNILVIWGDDIGITNISAYTMGLVGYRTPNIDRIANEGVLPSVASGVAFAEPQQIPVVSDGAMNSEQSTDAFSQLAFARGAGPSTSQAASRRSSRHEFVFSTRPGVWFPKADFDFSHENNAGLATELSLDNLSADDRDTAFNGRVNLRLGSHDVWLGGWTYAASGTIVASTPIIFGGLAIPISATVKTELDIQVIGLRYGYSFFSFEKNGFRLGPMLGVNYFDFEASLEVVNLNREESEEVQVPAPEVGAHFEIPLADFLISADISGLYLSTDDFDATFLDVESTLTWRPLDRFGILVGYRFLFFDIDGDDFDIEGDISGPLIRAEIRF
jgi:hypothetical protein